MHKIIFDEEALVLLKNRDFNKLFESSLSYDKHLTKAYMHNLIKFCDIKLANGLNLKELEETDPYTYNARCSGKIFNFIQQFSRKKIANDLNNLNPYNVQIGGTHYISKIQPVQFIKANKLNFNQGNVVKYIARYDEKNGIEDLAKVIQYTLFEAYEEYPEKYQEFVNKIKTMIGE
jgi:hypothetical protein